MNKGQNSVKWPSSRTYMVALHAGQDLNPIEFWGEVHPAVSSIAIMVLEKRDGGNPRMSNAGCWPWTRFSGNRLCAVSSTGMSRGSRSGPGSEPSPTKEKCFPGRETSASMGSVLNIRIKRSSWMKATSWVSHFRKSSTVGAWVRSITSKMRKIIG